MYHSQITFITVLEKHADSRWKVEKGLVLTKYYASNQVLLIFKKSA